MERIFGMQSENMKLKGPNIQNTTPFLDISKARNQPRIQLDCYKNRV